MNIIYILKSALLCIRSNLRNSIINITGLSAALTVFLLIVMFVDFQYSYNRHIPHYEEIFRLERGFHGITNALHGPDYSMQIPEIKSSCRITFNGGSLFYRPDEHSPAIRTKTSGVAADSSVLEMFDIEIKEQYSESLLQTPRSILISAGLAEKMFGGTPPVGKTVSLENKHDLVIEGVFETLPPESTMSFDAIFSLDLLPLTYGNPDYLRNYGVWRYETFFRLDPGNRDEVVRKIEEIVKEKYERSGAEFADENIDVNLMPLDYIYFSETADVLHKHGDKTNNLIFSIIAGFVLVIAGINFINLSTAQAGTRSKATGLKKILGASRTSLIIQICAEGIIIVFVSIIIALALSELLLPWYSEFVNIDLNLQFTPGNLILFLIIAPLVLGSLSGLFPAFYLSRVSPATILKKEMVTGKGGMRLRSFLTVFQFSISIFLIVGTFVVNKQLRFAKNYNPGYTTENIIQVTLNNQINDRFDVFKENSLANPSIEGITRMNQAIYRAGSVWSVFHNDKNFTWPFIQVDEDFVNVFGLEIVKGEDFSESMLQRGERVFLVNELVIPAFETDDILNEKVNNHEIVGVVNNFHTASLKSDMQPVTIALSPGGASAFGFIRLNPENHSEAIASLRNTWNELSPDYPLEYEYLTDKIENAYISEKKFMELFIYFALISIILSCLGLFALASYTTENRVKEICIRKVHGATSHGISLNLSFDLTKKVIISNLIAWPVAWYFMNRWLENFVYRTEPGAGEFLLAALTAQVIALATVSWHVYSTARKNPAKTLRYE